MTLHIQIQLLRWPFVRIYRGEHPEVAYWREAAYWRDEACEWWRTRAQDFSRMADSFAARLERQPGRDAGGRYCKR